MLEVVAFRTQQTGVCDVHFLTQLNGSPEVVLISGHRDTRMLSRYTRLRPEKLAKATLSQPKEKSLMVTVRQAQVEQKCGTRNATQLGTRLS